MYHIVLIKAINLFTLRTCNAMEEILELEKKVWNCLLTGNFEEDEKLLSDDFIGVYSDGFATKEDHTKQLKNGPVISDCTITDSKIVKLSINII